MNYATIKYCDIANGEGVRTSLFVSGCRRHCPNCFNAVAWDFGYGAPFTKEVRNEILESLAPGYINGLSLLGGEPFEPENQRELLPFVKNVKVLYPNKTIWCYTGYDFDKDLLAWMEAGDPVITKLLPLLDVIVDGEYKEECRNLRLPFRGSENQRILDVPLSLKEKCGIILHT
jgi:anaerobic ribonucleoside-triphosphate reductase activating protein